MLFLFQQYLEVILTLLKKLFKKNLFIFIGIFYPIVREQNHLCKKHLSLSVSPGFFVIIMASPNSFAF